MMYQSKEDMIEEHCRSCKYYLTPEQWKEWAKDPQYWYCVGCIDRDPTIFFNNYEKKEEP